MNDAPAHIFKDFDTEINTLKDKLSELGMECRTQLNKLISMLRSMDTSSSPYIIQRDVYINELQKEIEADVTMLIAKREPKGPDLRLALYALKISSNLERIGDYVKSIIGHIDKLESIVEKVRILSSIKGVIEMLNISNNMLGRALIFLAENGFEELFDTWQEDEEIDMLFAKMFPEVHMCMYRNEENIEGCSSLIFMGRCCERIGDHVTNILEDIFYIKTGQSLVSEMK